MQLLTTALRRQLPPLGSTQDDPDPKAICKFFTPDAGWTWYASEFDGEDLFFGWVEGNYPEWGYFSLSELERVRGHLGLPVERDYYFQPCRMSEVQGAWAPAAM